MGNRFQHRKIKCFLAFLLLLETNFGVAESVTVAVSANFLTPLRSLRDSFELIGQYQLVVVSGSTGQLHAQIVNGAPFDILLSADKNTPTLLVDSGFGEPGTQFTYARGQLVLWALGPESHRPQPLERLKNGDFRHLAIANPRIAPYGVAARQTLTALGIWERFSERIVLGENIGQTFSWVETGNAELGLVALSQALSYRHPSNYRIIPDDLYDPIRQDAILLKRGKENLAAIAFYDYLRSENAARIIKRYGYSRND
ncbi:MAG: molybdate ABC transporter substrate-binding protein [Gammaproteobacteria bacterium]